METREIIICIMLAIITTNLIRILPMAFIKGRIRNVYLRSFLYYVPYVTLAVMTFPASASSSSLDVCDHTASESPTAKIVSVVLRLLISGVIEGEALSHHLCELRLSPLLLAHRDINDRGRLSTIRAPALDGELIVGAL